MSWIGTVATEDAGHELQTIIDAINAQTTSRLLLRIPINLWTVYIIL